ncbi:MAG: phosphoribosylformylglycinamidine synthase subunit PurS [Saprospiraceae bacterium]|nr:phosphoribosylformylglycinamidine synthase subunit PurS [Saprospiraceae bacterium]
MPNFIAKIIIMPHKELLDPQGKTVAKNMGNVHIQGVTDVRIGKHIEMSITANTISDAEQIADQSCKKLLANLITETYSFKVEQA